MPPVSAAAASPCPACGGAESDRFYHLIGVPVHSCLLQSDRAQALAFPRADLQLALCRSCGFISNTRFDPAWSAYAPGYEDQQSFSPTFNQFARSLAERLIQRYDLRGRDILEIGCGKGDFLDLQCELGGNRGTGIDPSAVPERMRAEAAQRIRLVAEYFGAHHAGHAADFICCRHTLEHIPAVKTFLRTLRQVIGQRTIPVFFEVPDTGRVLRDCAFEDIYYEHCSYFTPGSLARLFRHCGFELDDLYLAYDGQYLCLQARPVVTPGAEPHRLEESVSDVRAAATRFGREVAASRAHWQEVLDRNRGRLALWGSGSKCVALLSSLRFDPGALCVVDINPHRHGRFLPGSGLEILAPETLRTYRPRQVIAMNRVYSEEIRRMLDRLGVKTTLSAL